MLGQRRAPPLGERLGLLVVELADTRRFASYHSYHPVATGYTHLDHLGYATPIEPAFGTEAELHTLVDEAHKRGIRVIPDFVANHIHKEGQLYARHPDWFFGYNACDGRWDVARIGCWFTTDTPDFDYGAHPDAIKAVVDHALWMIQEFNFDGFRADALKHMDDKLVRALKGASLPGHPRLAEYIEREAQQIADLYEESTTRDDGTGNVPMNTARFITEATRAFPKDGIMIRDGGATVVFTWTYNQAKPSDVVWNQNYGHIGTGLPYATGALLADQAETGKARPGMLLTSDSSFLFHIGELEVAVRKNLPLVCVVGVAFKWGLEVGVYRGFFGSGTAEPGVHWSNKVRFDKIAEGFGAAGEFVQRAEDLGPAIERAYQRGGPTVIHVPIEPKANAEDKPQYSEFKTWYAEGTQ